MWSGPPGQRRPANCTDIAPPDIPSSHIAVFDAETQTWSLQEDHRGETVYDTTTGNQVYISDLGPLPENVTSVSPGGGYKKWDSKAQVWMNDEAAEAAARLREAEGTKNRLLQIASEKIAPLQDAVDLDEASYRGYHPDKALEVAHIFWGKRFGGGYWISWIGKWVPLVPNTGCW